MSSLNQGGSVKLMLTMGGERVLNSFRSNPPLFLDSSVVERSNELIIFYYQNELFIEFLYAQKTRKSKHLYYFTGGCKLHDNQ